MPQSNSPNAGDGIEGLENACANCKKPQSELSIPLKRCAKCQNMQYCSRECQLADWKSHKKNCTALKAASGGQTNFNAMPKAMGDFFKTLVSDTYLHSFSEAYAYQQLIDCYRMRLEDDSNFANDERGIYAGEDPKVDFRRFLDLAESRRGLLPKWWTLEKRSACEDKAQDTTQWADIGRRVSKGGIIEHYGEGDMPMKLRLLAEKVYGNKVDMGF